MASSRGVQHQEIRWPRQRECRQNGIKHRRHHGRPVSRKYSNSTNCLTLHLKQELRQHRRLRSWLARLLHALRQVCALFTKSCLESLRLHCQALQQRTSKKLSIHPTSINASKACPQNMSQESKASSLKKRSPGANGILKQQRVHQEPMASYKHTKCFRS